MHRPALLALVCAAGLTGLAGRASAEGAVIGFAAPLSGPTALLGEQMLDGAVAAAAAVSGELVAADDACSPEGGAAAARRFIEAQAVVVTGFLCTESIEAALPLLKDAGIAVIATAIRSGGLTDGRTRTGWPVVRYSPRTDDEVRAVSAVFSRLWRSSLFAIVDDGTVYARDLAEGFRLAMEERGLKPVFLDTMRPQLDNQIGLAGRLRRSGATHVFVAGDRADVAILGRDAAGIGYDLVIAGGEVLRAAPEEVDLVDGTLMVALPEWSEIADPSVIGAFRAAGIEPEGYVLPAYASVEIASQAALLAERTGNSVLSVLEGGTFGTALGTIGFDARGDRTDNPYRLFRFEGGSFLEVD